MKACNELKYRYNRQLKLAHKLENNSQHSEAKETDSLDIKKSAAFKKPTQIQRFYLTVLKEKNRLN
ncbi:hypothetical protein MRY82_10405 [bacterium]|nr:hypothetical protein [bacterium]